MDDYKCKYEIKPERFDLIPPQFGVWSTPTGGTFQCKCDGCSRRFEVTSCDLCDKCWYDNKYGTCAYGGPYVRDEDV